MAKTEINISSKAIEKGLDAAKGFLSKLIGPAVEETGLLLKDHVAMWRFGNQVKMLNKARAKCEKHGISPKQISPKLLVPLLEGASLEEDEEMQDKWANMLTNMVDPDQNLQNHVFPYILGQLSKLEFEFLEQSFLDFKNKDEEYLMRFREGMAYREEPISLETYLEESSMVDSKRVPDYLLSNLVRLGLIISKTKIETSTDIEDFFQIKHPINKKTREAFGIARESITEVTSKENFHITSLTKMLINICSDN